MLYRQVIGTINSIVKEWVERTFTWQWTVFFLIFLVALVFRCWGLGDRAFHHDEYLHIQYSWNLANGHGFQHNPLMHGPFQFLLNAVVFDLFWASDVLARVSYAIAGAILVFLPYFLRNYVGMIPSLVISLMLAFSPSLLYFSRFARNDIYMALWTVILFILIWKYLKDNKDRYLFLSSAVLAFLYATKETAYIVTAIFAAFLFVVAAPEILAVIFRRMKLSEFSPASSCLLLLTTLMLPQWSAIIGIVQGPIGVILVNGDGALGLIGWPVGTGIFWVAGIISATIILSIAIGLRWRWKTWLVCAVIFYVIWATLYTTFFTNIGGLFTGIWQGLGYWVAQQGVERGGQPWYYYFVTGSVYELLPILFSVLAICYYLRKMDMLGAFLVFWSIATFIAYTYAGEKMPWLLVNVTLPLIFLSGKFIGDIFVSVPWRKITKDGSIALIISTPFAILIAVWILFLYVGGEFDTSLPNWILSGTMLAFLLLICVMIYRGNRQTNLLLLTLGLAIFLMGFGTTSGLRASYSHDDKYKEMFVYAQFSSDVKRVATSLKHKQSEIENYGNDTVIQIDDELRYAFEWYFREGHAYTNYRCFKRKNEEASLPGCSPLKEEPAVSAIIMTESHALDSLPYLTSFTKKGPYNHLLWFPEVYKGITIPDIAEGLMRRTSWRTALEFIMFRNIPSDWYNTRFVLYESLINGD